MKRFSFINPEEMDKIQNGNTIYSWNFERLYNQV